MAEPSPIKIIGILFLIQGLKVCAKNTKDARGK
jgi:hypothetical protein